MSEIKVNSIKNTNSNDGGLAIDSSGHVQVDGVQMPTAGALFARNKILNGSMEVAQRGTSSTGNGYVSLDRWYVNQSGGSTTFSQETFAAGSEIGSLKNYAKLDVTTSSDFTNIFQRIEDVRTVPAGTITVSFQAKGTTPSGGLAVYLAQNFGTSGSSDVDIAQQTVTLTSSWQRFDLQFTVPSISGKTINANSYFQVSIGQGTNTGTTAFELNITGVQLEIGDKATEFSHEPYSVTLAKCQRYYYRLDRVQDSDVIGPGYASSTATLQSMINFPVTMRSNPTSLEQTGTAGDYAIGHEATATSCTTVPTFINATNTTARFYVSATGALTEGNGGQARFNAAGAFIAFPAEL